MYESKAAWQAVKLIVYEIYKAVDNGINNAKFDITKKATTSSVLADNIYQIQGRKAFSFKAGDVLDVLIPENNLTNMYIAGSISSTSSSSGGGGSLNLANLKWSDLQEGGE